MEDDNQGRSEQAAVPVLEAVPPVIALVADVPPTEAMPSTETALVAAGPTTAGLGMPKEPPTMPGPSTVEYNVQRLPEDQVGADGGRGQESVRLHRISVQAKLGTAGRYPSKWASKYLLSSCNPLGV